MNIRKNPEGVSYNITLSKADLDFLSEAFRVLDTEAIDKINAPNARAKALRVWCTLQNTLLEER